MSNYRRAYVPGGTYFFTVCLEDRASMLLTERIDDLRAAYVATILDLPVVCDAMVVLPDHLHAVWTLPPGDVAYPERWRLIKYRFTRRLGLRFPRNASKRRKREAGLWQRRYWEHVIRDERDYRSHVAYCWWNPVGHGLVERAIDWPWSTLRRDVRRGLVDPAWIDQLDKEDFGRVGKILPTLRIKTPPPNGSTCRHASGRSPR